MYTSLHIIGYYTTHHPQKKTIHPYYLLIFRSFNPKLGAGIHLDRLNFDSPELNKLRVKSQISLILHLSGPSNGSGGETVVFDQAFDPEHQEDSLFKTSGWKYSDEIVST